VRRAALSLLLAAAALSAGCSRQQPVAVPVELFLANHWAEPIPPQGPPPNGFSVLEASLSPQACGQCHAQQYEAWRTSLHSRTVGPGLLWQLALMDQAQANRCFRCHAPLAEQKALLAIEHGWLGASAPPATCATIVASARRHGLMRSPALRTAGSPRRRRSRTAASARTVTSSRRTARASRASCSRTP